MSSLVIKSIHRDEKIATSIKDGGPAAAATTEEELLEKEDVPSGEYGMKKSNYLSFVGGEVCNRFLCFCTARPPLI